VNTEMHEIATAATGSPSDGVTAAGENVRCFQKRLPDQAAIGRRFGTFTEVFRPTLLTILGASLYLLFGWVVGNAGLFGTLLIILLACTITSCTGLAMSSITTCLDMRSHGNRSGHFALCV